MSSFLMYGSPTRIFGPAIKEICTGSSLVATSHRTASRALVWSSSTEQLMICATSSLEKSRPAFSADSLIILRALTVYSGEHTALSTTPSPISPASRSPTAGELIQSRQRLRHHNRPAQTNDLRRSESKILRRQSDGCQRAHRIAHQLDGLGKKSHLKTALLRLPHDIGHFLGIGKLTVA